MKIWNTAFITWKDICPFIRRELFSKEGFIQWTRDLKLISGLEENDFFVFLVFLEECEILCPLAFAEQNQGRIYQPIHLIETPIPPKNTEYYHPIQFMEVINWFRYNSLTRKPYHYSQNFRNYFSLRRIERKIKKTEFQIEYYESRGSNQRSELINNFKENLAKFQEEKENHPLFGFDFPKGLELIKYLKIGWTRNILSEERLVIWIKIESLLLQDDAHIYSPHPPYMRLDIDFPYYFGQNNKIKQEIEKYREWRRGVVFEKAIFLNENEKNMLKDFHKEIGHRIGEGDFGSYGNSGNWNDLLDILPPFKKDKLTGMTSYFINLLSIYRYIERFYWEFFEKNINFGRETDTKPHFSVITPEDYRNYMESVLLQFGLILTNPFALYVEGATEKNIIEKYLQKSKTLDFRIENTQGETNLPFFIRISKDIKDWHIYYFLDYDNLEKYRKRKKDIGTLGCFFFPDFITENFSVEEFKNALFGWLEDFNILIDQDFKNKIEFKLVKEKERSNEIIHEVEEKLEIKSRNTLGFEKSVLNILKQYCCDKIVDAYPDQLSLDQNGFIENYRDFENIFKTEIADRLSLVVLDSIENDPERRSKFSFENKLDPFYKSIAKILDHVPYWL
jgi:hypothetical protein